MRADTHICGLLPRLLEVLVCDTAEEQSIYGFQEIFAGSVLSDEAWEQRRTNQSFQQVHMCSVAVHAPLGQESTKHSMSPS